MAQNILVERYVDDTKKFLSVLDKNGRRVSALFWFYSEGHQAWRLVVASSLFDDMMQKHEMGLLDVYSLIVNDTLEADLERLQSSDVQVEATHHKLVRAVREEYIVVAGQKPIWLDGFAYNSSYVDGMVILRSIKPLEEHNG
jgi:hypothetical protein